jgi:hypothetical protein
MGTHSQSTSGISLRAGAFIAKQHSYSFQLVRSGDSRLSNAGTGKHNAISGKRERTGTWRVTSSQSSVELSLMASPDSFARSAIDNSICQQVGNDSSGYYSRDVETSSLSTLQGKTGEEGRPGGCLRRAAYTRPSATPAGN